MEKNKMEVVEIAAVKEVLTKRITCTDAVKEVNKKEVYVCKYSH